MKDVTITIKRNEKDRIFHMTYIVYLFRHAKTEGNYAKRYIGLTDEPLHPEGIRMLEAKISPGYYPHIERVYSSPMQRCRQTAELIYPSVPLTVVPGFAEYNFGEYEGKTYEELKNQEDYQKWIASAGMAKTPRGEDISSFKQRCSQAFEEAVSELISKRVHHAVFIVHGGTIMAILDEYLDGDHSFYTWQVKNCEGYTLTITEDLWKSKKRIQDAELYFFPNE